jgi:hypothetical protein
VSRCFSLEIPPPTPPAGGGTAFALPKASPALPGGDLVQQVVHSVFFTVVSVVATLLTVGLTGLIILLATARGHVAP